VSTSINDDRFQASSAVGQSFLSAYAAELSEDREIFNFDNDGDLPFVRQILASSKQAKRVTKMINFTRDDDGDSKSDDGNYTEIN
jgi:hypothetical protein